MKKRFYVLGCVVALMLVISQVPLNPSYAAGLTNNAQEVLMAQAVYVETDIEGMLPLRYTAESCGYTVVWNEDRSILLQKDGHEIKLQIGSRTILLDGEIINLHYTPVLIRAMTYLPVEFYNSVLTEKYITQTGAGTYMLSDKTPVSASSMMDTVQDVELENQSFGDSDYMYFPARLIPALDFSHPIIRGEYHMVGALAAAPPAVFIGPSRHRHRVYDLIGQGGHYDCH